jgi:protein-S-isoprenylcysteine O-methyltransferase Ste14
MYLGLGATVAGAVVIAVYTLVNHRLRRGGPKVVWRTGWVLGALGMTLFGAGWVFLALSEPHLSFPDLWALVLRAAGVASLCLAGIVYLLAARRVGRWRRLRNYNLRLHTDGIYRLVRHPQALALLLVGAGIGLVSLSVPYLATMPVWLSYWVGYAFLEERFDLLPAYGAQYTSYAEVTPRLIPTLRSWKAFLNGDRVGAPALSSRARRRESARRREVGYWTRAGRDV